MPRSSRHESSHRGHKHSSREARERSDSEEEGNSRERRSREESAVAASASRVSRDLEYEKRKSSTSSQVSQGKEVTGSGNGDFNGDHGKKRKERPVESGAAADRCNGGDGVDERDLRGEELGHADVEGKAKAKALAVDSKGRSGRRHEGASERKENSAGKDDSAKRRSEKDYGRRESSLHHKDGKDRERERGLERDREQGSERDRERGSDRDRERGSDRDRESGLHRGRENWLEKERERGSDREKKIQDAKRERSSDASSRRHGGRAGSVVEEECLVKGDAENAELPVQDELCNTELEKELEKRIQKRTDDFHDKGKWQEDIRDGDNNVSVPLKSDKWQAEGGDGEDRRVSSREVRMKNGGYKDEQHKDGSYRDKYREVVDRVQRHQDDKARDDHSSRDHTSDRSYSKHYRDEKGSSDNHKRNKHQDSDHDGSPYTDDHGTKYKDGRGRKRPSDEYEDHIDVKPRNAKELCANLERSAYHYNVDGISDRDRPGNVFPDKVDFSTRPKSSPSSSAQYSRDQYRHGSKQMEGMPGNILSEERSHMASPGNSGTALVVHERVTEHRSLEKSKPKGERRPDELSLKSVPSSKYERSPRSDGPGSPVQLTEKAPSSTSDRRRSNRTGVRRSLDVEEMGQRSSSLKDGTNFAISEDKEQEQPKEKPVSDDRSQVDLVNSYSIPAGSSSLNRADNASSGFPNHFPPPTRFGTDSPVLGSFDEDRVLLGDRKSGARYKRNMDFNMSRGQGNAWRGIQNWPSPVANGFIPFQHLPPSGGFHPVVQQFPPPSLFGIRPSMDMSHTGVPYPMHETPDRFSSHARPFGWRNPGDDSCPSHLQGWDGNNGIPMDESHIYRRPEWEQSRPLLGNRGWEMSMDVWKGQNGNNNMELPVPQKELDYATNVPPDETWAGQPTRQPHSELARSPTESNEVKQPCETTPLKDAVEVPPKVLYEQTPEPSKTSKDDGAHFCRVYLSKIEISADLARPELYKQCMSLIGTVDSCSDVSKNHRQGIGRDAKVELKGSNLLNSHFAAVPDAVFQRAMSLYKKQNEIMKKTPQLFCEARGKKDSCAEEKVAQDENLAFEDVAHDVVNPPGNEDGGISTDAKCIPIGNPVEQPSDTLSTVVFVEDPQACEVLMPECSLNLSRIHHSSESTH